MKTLTDLLLTLVFFVATTGVAQAEEVSFSLPNEIGEVINFSGEGISVLEWTNPGCPFVKKFYNNGFIQQLQEQFVKKGVTWVTINSTNPDHKDFVQPENRSKEKVRQNINATHFLFDEDGSVGQALGAKTTPHIFVLKGKEVIYKGAIDDAADTDSDPSEAKNYVSDVLNKLVKGEEVEASKTRPYGCSVKY